MTAQDEGSRAQHWRQVIMRLSIKQLSDLTGYSVTAIRCFEANANTSGELFGADAWKRYRSCCGYVDAVRRSGVLYTFDFNWRKNNAPR